VGSAIRLVGQGFTEIMFQRGKHIRFTSVIYLCDTPFRGRKRVEKFDLDFVGVKFPQLFKEW